MRKFIVPFLLVFSCTQPVKTENKPIPKNEEKPKEQKMRTDSLGVQLAKAENAYDVVEDLPLRLSMSKADSVAIDQVLYILQKRRGRLVGEIYDPK